MENHLESNIPRRRNVKSNESPALEVAIKKKRFPVIPRDPILMIAGAIQKRPTLNKCLYNCAACIAVLFGILLALAVITLTLPLLIPACETFNGRVCNERGQCVKGVCECNMFYSGKACTESQVPGYVLDSNTECSNQGFAIPYRFVPDVCNQTIQNGNLVNGWGSQACFDYVTKVWSLIEAANGDVSKVPQSATIPTCFCYGGFGGKFCTAAPGKVDENGEVCGGHGDTSVGFYENNTDSGVGLRCERIFAFYDPENADLFTPEALDNLLYNYYTQYHKTYCGNIYRILINGQYVPNVVVGYTPEDSLKCFCADDWKGDICTEGKCPMNDQEMICSGNGHPLKGQNYLPVTTASTLNGIDCEILCANNYKRCGTKCYYDGPQYGYAVMNQASYCSAQIRCPDDEPIRCSDNTCVSFPTDANGQCVFGYGYGSIDYSQLDESISLFRCPNITDVSAFEACFFNQTEIAGIIDGSYIPQGGFVMQSNYTITVDLGSPLIYFEITSNISGLSITTWDGQFYSNNRTGVSAGLFTYAPGSNKWKESVIYSTELIRISSNTFSLGPMPWNYTSGTLFNSSFSSVRVTSSVTGVVVVVNAKSSQLIKYPWDEELISNGVFIYVNTTDEIAAEPLWYYPDGTIASGEICFSIPSDCAWYVEPDLSQVRSLDSEWYVCNETLTLIVQDTPCATPFSSYIDDYVDLVFVWETALQGTIQVPMRVDVSTFDLYELPYQPRTSYPFTISWVNEAYINFTDLDFGDIPLVLVQSPVFLTKDKGITFPCACDQSSLATNQTILNQAWWLDRTTFGKSAQSLIDVLETGSFLLAPDYSQGEATLYRTVVVNIDKVSETASVKDINSDYFFYTAINEARVLDAFELVDGLPDSDLLSKPFKCPDGSGSTAEADVFDIDVTCNCTYSIPIADCNCTDTQHFFWSCQYNNTLIQSECGNPGDHQFERDLSVKLNDLVTSACSCVLDMLTDAEKLNTSSVIPVVDDTIAIFNFTYEQIPTYFVTQTTGIGCKVPSFLIYASSTLFTSIHYPITYEVTSENITCEHWLTLHIPAEPAFSSIYAITTDDSVMSWAVLVYSVKGYSLGVFGLPEITASSNSEDAPNVNLIDSTYWESDNPLSTYPIWIQMHFEEQRYLDYTRVVFYSAGRHMGNYSIPERIYLEATNNNKDWTVLGSWGVFVEPGGWYEVSMVINSTVTFSTYRLTSVGQQFAIRIWQLFTKEVCTCDDGTHLSVNFNSTEGLNSISEELANLVFWGTHLYNVSTCECVDDCFLFNKNMSNNGECNDAVYAASVLHIVSSTELINTTYYEPSLTNQSFTVYLHSVDIPGFQYDVIQMATAEEFFFPESEFPALLDQYLQTSIFIGNFTTGTFIGFLYIGELNLLAPPILEFERAYSWVEGTLNISDSIVAPTYNDLVALGFACHPGYDCMDCGPSIRTIPLMKGYTCQPNPRQTQLLAAIQNTTILENRGFLAANLSGLVSYWNSFYQDVRLTRAQPRIKLDNCPHQTCPFLRPYKCDDGSCAKNSKACHLLYSCPGNGCVKLLDIGTFDNYRCACSPGFNGDACQFGVCKPARPPFYQIERGATPASEECSCGGPPPFRLKPPVLNKNNIFTNEELEMENNRPTGNSVPKSTTDINYHSVMPLHAPWGQVVKRKVVLRLSKYMTEEEQTIYTTCPCLRVGERGEQFLLTDDVESRNLITGRPRWKKYILASGTEVSYPWTNICTYDQAAYRCPNAQCVANPVLCAQSQHLFPLCNGRGSCRSDGTCVCDSNFETFMISNEYSAPIRFPYYSYLGITDPTVWRQNYNWKHFALNQCTARNCNLNNCEAPVGCFTGTPSIGFTDRHVLCPSSTGALNRCAASIEDCIGGNDLSFPMVCSGNGIIRTKDETNEKYCACGTPISPLVNITGVSQITQLEPNGYGGVDCATYYADVNAPLVWSAWNEAVDEPYYSKISGRVLPGIWIKGNIIMGPKPEDRLLWDQCCPDDLPLEECPYVPCNVPPQVKCLSPPQCLAIKETAPMVYPCNGHGTARADGTCDCDVDETAGEAYTHDDTQFSEPGCFLLVKCPISVNGGACNPVSACSEPGEWRHPLPYDVYLENQWNTCPYPKGPFTDVTKLAEMSINVDTFNEQLEGALATIAISVLEAEADLQGCVCVYPNDTQTDRCCMVDNDKTYVYDQNYAKPYLISITIPGYPYLTDDTLEPVAYTGEYAYFEAGDSFNVTLDNPEETTLSAIRLFDQGNNSIILFKNSNGDQVCPRGEVVPADDNIMQWNLGAFGNAEGSVGYAHYCGPFYSCVNTHTFPEYTTFCGVDVEVPGCVEYKLNYCTQSSSANIYWPSDSLDIYQGCLRVGVDQDGCVCCHQDTENAPIIDGLVTVEVTNAPLLLGQVRFYGATGTAIEVPPGLRAVLDETQVTECQDAMFLRSILGADGTLFTITNQEMYTKVEALDACNYTGGYLAVPQDVDVRTQLEEANPRDLIRECQSIGVDKVVGNPTCWVDAINIINDTITPRNELFYDDTCTTWGCYEFSNKFSFVPFYVNNTAYYDTSKFTNQVSATTVAERLQRTEADLGNSFVIWSKTQITTQMEKVVLTFQLIPSGTKKSITLTIDPVAATTDDTYLFGEMLNLHQILNLHIESNLQGPRAWKSFTASPNIALQVYEFNDDVCKTFVNLPKKKKFMGLNKYLPKSSLILSNFDKPAGSSYTKRYTTVCDPTDLGDVCFNDLTRSKCWAFIWGTDGAKVEYKTFDLNMPKKDNGTVGLDRTMGWLDHQYVPMFATTSNFGVVGSYPVMDVATRLKITSTRIGFPFYLQATGAQLATVPYPNMITQFPHVSPCSQCIKINHPLGLWDQLAYSTSVWQNQFQGPLAEIYLRQTTTNIPLAPSSIFKVRTRLDVYRTMYPAVFVHQVNYINSKVLNPNPPYFQWYVPQCMMVTAGGLVAEFCDQHHYAVCLRDWTKYAVVPGYSCDKCGPSVRFGGGVPDEKSCYAALPLANATLFPFEHLVKDNYLRGTLSEFAESFDIEPTVISFGNTSIFAAFPDMWTLWDQGFSSRPGQTSVNVAPELNWCDLCLTCNWPVDCGLQVNPETNIAEHFCAATDQYCNLNIANPTNALMKNSTRPEILNKVDPDLAYTNPTCGPNVNLGSFAKTDKFGAVQSELFIYNKILNLQSNFIQLQVSTSQTQWYNGGKSPVKYSFQWNLTATISASYQLSPCEDCIDPILEVIIYPISPFYTFPDTYLSQNVSLTVGDLSSFEVNFTVTETDTGSYYLEGELFPLIVFKNIGFFLHGVTVGSGFLLYNPTITDAVTREECTTREAPQWYERRPRIKSTAPERSCIFTKAQQLRHPGLNIGECACDLSSAGKTCDCPAVTSKFGKEVCGGFGDSLASVRTPTGLVTQTGGSTEAGCFTYDATSDCKTIDIGTALYTLLVDGAIFDYPSVFIETLPIKGSGIYKVLPNTADEYLNYGEVEDKCIEIGMKIPYYYSPDELNQLALESRGLLPIFMSVNMSGSSETTWPWDSPIFPAYFIRDTEPTPSSEDGTCAGEVCDIVNFNNYAFLSTLSPAVTYDDIIDGDTLVAVTISAPVTLTWSESSPLKVLVYLFGNTNPSAFTCLSGVCDTGTTVGSNIYFACRCPNRVLTIASGQDINEIQIFGFEDTMRSTSYTYN